MNAAEILNQENEIERMRSGQPLHWHERLLTEGQLAEMVYKKPLEEILRLVPAGHRVIAVRPANDEEWVIDPLDGKLCISNAAWYAPVLIVDSIPQPQFTVRFEYVGPFGGGAVPDNHVAIDEDFEDDVFTFGAGEQLESTSGKRDLYRVVRV